MTQICIHERKYRRKFAFVGFALPLSFWPWFRLFSWFSRHRDDVKVNPEDDRRVFWLPFQDVNKKRTFSGELVERLKEELNTT